MKKRRVVGLFLFIILSLSLTFVSAGTFSDFLDKITGKVTSGVCGNGILEAGELCDGEDVLGSINSCEDFGFASGSLSCINCRFDTSNCVAKTPTATCGNGILELGEGCDSGSQNGIACSPSYGSSCNYCSSQCQTIIIGGPYCGDGICNGAESFASCVVDCPNTPANQTPTNNTKINQNPSNLLAGGAISGLFYSTHIDDFENFVPEKKYALLVDNKFYDLRLQDDPQIPSGTPVIISGSLQGNNLIIANSIQAISAARVITTNQNIVSNGSRLLIMLVEFSDSPPRPFTSSEIQDRFYGDFNKFYQENSYGKLNWQITVSDWITLPYSSKELTEGKGVYAVALDSLVLASQKINLNSYDQILLINNDIASHSYAFGHAFTTLDLSSSISAVGARSIKYDWWGGTNALIFYAIHETGHNLLINDYFLPHANGLYCERNISSPSNPPCQHIEYGNIFDAMGYGIKGLHFNSYFKEAEGWFDNANSIESIFSSGRYSLTPLETFGGTKSLKIPLQNGQFYYIEHRSPAGYDRSNYDDSGLVITLVYPDNFEDGAKNWGWNYLIDAENFPGEYEWNDYYASNDRRALKLDDKYEDQLRKVVIGPVTKMDSTGATLDICLGDGCFSNTQTNNTCTDSDGGYNTFIRGTATDNKGNLYTDYCETENTLVEYECKSSPAGDVGSNTVVCSNISNGCLNGECVQENQTATCNFISANWNTNGAVEGENVYLNVQGQNCDGKEISFVIYEKDILSGDDSVNINPSRVNFSGNSATISWIAEWQDDETLGLGGNPEYYFIAYFKNGQTIVSIVSNLLLIRQKICTTFWECTDWSECLDSTQTRTCTDLNNCGKIADKPEESQECTIDSQPTCTTFWECTDWSECLDSTQTRTCNDLNSCGTLLNKPKESQSCTSEPTLPPQTFFDNVRNIIKNLLK